MHWQLVKFIDESVREDVMDVIENTAPLPLEQMMSDTSTDVHESGPDPMEKRGVE